MGDMSELSVLKHLCNKDFYNTHRNSIDIEDLSKELHSILRVIDAHYLTDDASDLTVDDLSNIYFSTPRAKVEFYQGIFEALRANEAGMDTTVTLIQGLQQARIMRELSILAYDASEGRKSLQEILDKVSGLSTSKGELCADKDNDFVVQDLGKLVSECTGMAGLRFRLGSLNKALGPLRKGDFGFIFARPETGKTTFLASEVSYMAQQTTQPILWINNEEESRKVMLRCYQAALGIDLSQLMSNVEDNQKRFHEITKENIKLKDAVSINYKQIEKLCAQITPALVVFDQIDKIKGFDNDREDLRLGSIYIWARELAKQYCPIIGVCQADGTGEGQRWLTMANVANAKTSKQAEADWILGIGKVNDVGYDNLRFMHLSKNKLTGGPDSDPKMRHDKFECIIETMI